MNATCSTQTIPNFNKIKIYDNKRTKKKQVILSAFFWDKQFAAYLENMDKIIIMIISEGWKHNFVEHDNIDIKLLIYTSKCNIETMKWILDT